MKETRLLSFLLACIMLICQLPVTVAAASGGEVDWDTISEAPSSDFKFTAVNDDTGYKITGYTGSAAYIKIPKELTKENLTLPVVEVDGLNGKRPTIAVYIPEGVTTLSSSSFNNNKNLTTIVLPSTLTTIGGSAFSQCTKLANINLGKVKVFGSSAFQGCAALTTADLSSATQIDTMAFYGCTALTTVTLPSTLTTIQGNVFNGCTSLETINLGNITSIGVQAFQNCTALRSVDLSKVETIQMKAFMGSGLTSVALPSSFNSNIVGNYIFANCTSLTTVALPSNMTLIPQEMFSGCTNLSSINMPESLIYIQTNAFNGCTNLTSVTLPTGLKQIFHGAFMNTGLTSIVLPAGLETLGGSGNTKGVFEGCTNLVSVTLPIGTNSHTIHKETFKGCTSLATVTFPEGYTKAHSFWTIDVSAFEGCTSLTGITLPTTITTINKAAFMNSGLTSIVIPDSVTTLGCPSYADTKGGIFEGCTALTSVTLPSNISISQVQLRMFYGCTALESITIPDNYTDIRSRAFEGCTNLETVNWSNKLKTINSYAFKDCTSLQSLDLPATVGTLADQAFKGCTGLESVDLSACSELNQLGTELFYECSSLAEIILPDNLKNIYSSAFAKTGITEIVIPANVQSLYGNVFLNCTSLESVTINGKLNLLFSSAFGGCTALKYVDFTAGFPTSTYVRSFTSASADFTMYYNRAYAADAPENYKNDNRDYPIIPYGDSTGELNVIEVSSPKAPNPIAYTEKAEDIVAALPKSTKITLAYLTAADTIVTMDVETESFPIVWDAITYTPNPDGQRVTVTGKVSLPGTYTYGGVEYKVVHNAYKNKNGKLITPASLEVSTTIKVGAKPYTYDETYKFVDNTTPVVNNGKKITADILPTTVEIGVDRDVTKPITAEIVWDEVSFNYVNKKEGLTHTVYGKVELPGNVLIEGSDDREIWVEIEVTVRPAGPIVLQEIIWPSQKDLTFHAATSLDDLKTGINKAQATLVFADGTTRPVLVTYAGLDDALKNYDPQKVAKQSGYLYNTSVPLPADVTNPNGVKLQPSKNLVWVVEANPVVGIIGPDSPKEKYEYGTTVHDVLKDVGTVCKLRFQYPVDKEYTGTILWNTRDNDLVGYDPDSLAEQTITVYGSLNKVEDMNIDWTDFRVSDENKVSITYTKKEKFRPNLTGIELYDKDTGNAVSELEFDTFEGSNLTEGQIQNAVYALGVRLLVDSGEPIETNVDWGNLAATIAQNIASLKLNGGTLSLNGKVSIPKKEVINKDKLSDSIPLEVEVIPKHYTEIAEPADIVAKNGTALSVIEAAVRAITSTTIKLVGCAEDTATVQIDWGEELVYKALPVATFSMLRSAPVSNEFYNPANSTAQSFLVEGTISGGIPDGVVDYYKVGKTVYVTVIVSAKVWPTLPTTIPTFGFGGFNLSNAGLVGGMLQNGMSAAQIESFMNANMGKTTMKLEQEGLEDGEEKPTVECTIEWDVNNAEPAYDPEKSEDQTITVPGVMTIPAGVLGEEEETRNVEAEITIKGWKKIVEVIAPTPLEIKHEDALDSKLPTQVQIKLDDDSTDYATVTWNTSSYDSTTTDAATYEFPTASFTLPDKVRSNSEVENKATITVKKAEKAWAAISAISEVEEIRVPNGTPFDAIGLPATVKITLADQTTFDGTLTWDYAEGETEYNVSDENMQEFDMVATITVPGGYVSTNEKTLDDSYNITVHVTVAAKPVLVSIKNTVVDTVYTNGTNPSTYELPETVRIEVENDPKTYGPTELDADVTWYPSQVTELDYAHSETGAKTIRVPGKITLLDEVVNKNGVSLDTYAEVTVLPKLYINGFTAPQNITEETGTLSAEFALDQTVALDLSDDTFEPMTASIRWNLKNLDYDPNDAREQRITVTGVVELPDGVYNVAGVDLNVSVVVTVEAGAKLESIGAIDGKAVPNGTLPTAYDLPTTVKLTFDKPYSDENTTEYYASITWQYDEIAPNDYAHDLATAKDVTVTGIFDIPAKTYAPNTEREQKITVTVTVEPKDAITGIGFDVTEIDVPNGSDLEGKLPTEVVLELEKGGTDRVTITGWDYSEYDANKNHDEADKKETVLTAYFTLPDTYRNEIGNPGEAGFTVNVLPKDTVVGISFPTGSFDIPNSGELGDKLPEYVVLDLLTGEDVQLPITDWDKTALDANKLHNEAAKKETVLTATFEIPAFYRNPESIQNEKDFTVYVLSKAQVTGVQPITDINAANGDSVTLPDTVTLTTVFENTPGTAEADVVWDRAELEANLSHDDASAKEIIVDGTITNRGDVIDPENKGKTISVKVTIAPKAMLTEVGTLTQVVVENDAKAEEIELPGTVTLTFNKEIPGGSTTFEASIVWNRTSLADVLNHNDAANKETTLTGSYSLPNGTIAPNGWNGEITVSVAVKPKLKLESVTPPAAITDIEYGATLEQIESRLPATAKLVREDASEVDGIITWDEITGYNPELLEAQTFTVRGKVALPANTINPADPTPVSLDVTIEITVGAAPEFTGIKPLAPITGVANGTPAESLPLPETATIELSNSKTREARIDWDEITGYDPTYEAEQTFTVTGEIIMPDDVRVSQDPDLGVSVSVTVSAKLVFVSAANPDTLVVEPGTQITAASLPKTVTITLDDRSTREVSVSWNLSTLNGYDPKNSDEQSFTLTGSFRLPADVANPENLPLTVSMTVTFEEDSNANFAIWYMIVKMNQKFTVTSTAGEGGTITPEGETKVKYSREISFTVTADLGNAIKSIRVNGEEVEITNPKEMTVTIDFLKADSIVEATFTDAWENPFEDVPADAEYLDALRWAELNGIIEGDENGSFNPDEALSREAFVAILGRLTAIDGEDYDESSFDDVEADAWYTAYIAWAEEHDIVFGYGDGSFGIADEVVTEQAAAILARFAAFIGGDTASEFALTDYVDAALVEEWAYAAMQWTVENGIIAVEGDMLDPKASVLRREAVVMIYNLMNTLGK
ncbi:MAG: leucine-rich repeat protein [Clostridia bacterium]|nr:leucine-rich repeat protein [Clostridia bacterium]